MAEYKVVKVPKDGAKISRQEKHSVPLVEQEPQRVDWSRTLMRLGAQPKIPA